MRALPPKSDQLRQPVKTEFDPETGYVVVRLDKAEYGYTDQPVRYQDRVFHPKQELHITVVSREAADMVLEFVNRTPEAAARVQEMIDETRWSYLKLDTYYHVEESSEEEETIIQMVDLPYMPDFFKQLSGLVGHGFVLPPTHVTLYMRGTEKGIGLPTKAEFDRLVQRAVHPDEVQPAAPGQAQSTV